MELRDQVDVTHPLRHSDPSRKEGQPDAQQLQWISWTHLRPSAKHSQIV